MTIPKFRAVIVVFLIGFALGLSVFVASRLFVRSVLNSDAIAAAEEVAAQLARSADVETTGALSSIVQYKYYDRNGTLVASDTPNGTAEQPVLSESERNRITNLASTSGSVIDDAPLLPSLFGLSDAIKWVVVPVRAEGGTRGTLLAEVDQTRSLEALTRAFSVVGMVTVGLAVLAVISVVFVVTRGAGLGRQRAFDASTLPRDPLTDVPTRSGLTAALEDAVARAAETDQQVGLMIVGLDGFRAVNDIWGHAAGDAVLQEAAERLRAFASGPVGVARVAGDEFAVIVEGDDTQSMHKCADGIREAIGKPFEIEGSSILLGASIGTALYPINAESGQFLFRAADSALSKAKALGRRNALAVFDTEMKERMQRKATLERDMRLALERGEFVVFYQPQLELASGLLRGYEALVRWERPHEGILAPRDFLTVAEETGLIREIGDWVLRRACQDAASWLESGIVAVNFSAAQFRASDVDMKIAKVLEETGLAPERLEIEVPEDLFLNHAPEVMEALRRIKALGVRVAVDNFGGGYTGLAALARFPFDKVKIDRTFVSQLTEDAGVAAIVSAIVALGRTLSVDVTAEGVERSEQVTLLQAAGCSIVQGFLFGAPRRQSEDGPAETATEPPARAASG